MSALARELEEARKRAGDASEEAARLRCTLTATESDAAYWRAECRAAEVRGDRLMAESDALRRERDEARADLASAEAARDTALDAIDAAWEATGLPQVVRDTLPLADVVRDYETALLAQRGVIAPMPEQQQLPETPATEAPHRVGDTWHHGSVGSRTARDVATNARGEPIVSFGGAAFDCVPRLKAAGWRRIRCASEVAAAPTLTGEQVRALLVEGDAVAADLKRRMRGKIAPYEVIAPAVGDPVRVRLLDGRAVEGRITRAPTEGTREGYRVEAAGGLEAYGRAADLELLAGEK